jgi:hypothetical protein
MVELAEDDTLYDVTCWAHQHGGYETYAIYNKNSTKNSRDAAFMTFGAKSAYPERVVKRTVNPVTGDVTIETIALEVKDNHKFTSVGRFATPMRRLGNDTKEAYRQKAWERNHRRTGIYGQMEGETRTSNPDVDDDGNLIEGVELDFDNVEDGLHPHAYLRLFVDDTESWYRYDRLPGVSSLDEEPMGVWWNLPDVENHRTTLWSENGCLHIEHVTPEEEDAT